MILSRTTRLTFAQYPVVYSGKADCCIANFIQSDTIVPEHNVVYSGERTLALAPNDQSVVRQLLQVQHADLP